MALDIFRLNWIFIDIIIIILLILFLLGVKIYKGLNRWRKSLSNESLISRKYNHFKNYYKRLNIKIKHLRLIQNSNFNKEAIKRLSIIIIRTNRKKKITKILTQGLSSYGFNIISLHLKKINKSNKSLNEKNHKENENIISDIVEFFSQNNVILNNNYVIINYGKSDLLLKPIFSDINKIGFLLINPKINKSKINYFIEFKKYNHRENHIDIIFTERLNLFCKNPNLKRFKTKLFQNNKELFKLITLEKARASFKYYETILISKIIFLIERMNNNFRRES
jgi:hypothetical protein